MSKKDSKSKVMACGTHLFDPVRWYLQKITWSPPGPDRQGTTSFELALDFEAATGVGNSNLTNELSALRQMVDGTNENVTKAFEHIDKVQQLAQDNLDKVRDSLQSSITTIQSTSNSSS